jgi:hypothetical protein
LRALCPGGSMSDLTNGELPADADLDPQPEEPKKKE